MAYSLDLRVRIVEAVKAGYSHSKVAQRYSVGIATIGRCVQRANQGALAPESPPTCGDND